MLKLAQLETLRDSNGSIALGWINHEVYFARFVGSLSAGLGRAHLDRLENALASVQSLVYFSDASALASYDLLARSAFVRLILEHRRKFSSLVMLTWAGGVTASTEAFTAAVGGSVQVIRDRAEFEKQLSRAAPLARQLLAPRPVRMTPRAPPVGDGER